MVNIREEEEEEEDEEDEEKKTAFIRYLADLLKPWNIKHALYIINSMSPHNYT